MIRILLICFSFLPLCFHGPYLLQAWSSSRLDQWDWIYFVLTVPAALWAWRGEKTLRRDWRALLFLLPVLAVTAGTPWHQINALGIAAAAGTVWGVLWLTSSWTLAYRLLPAAVILLLGTPSSSYQLSLLLMCPVWMAWGVKLLLAAACFVWIWGNKKWKIDLKKGTVFFSAAVVSSCFLLYHTRDLYFQGRAFVPEFSGRAGEFFGRRIQPDANTLRFFATGKVRQFRYADNASDISVLAVQCGGDIHEIHPASHCLRTSLWTINSEKTLHLNDDLAVTEIDAQKGASRYLVWVWYSSENFSTPSFLGFRRHFKAGRKYFTYQISTAVHGDAGQGRLVLKRFLRSLRQEKKQ